jgi:uncharacterized protein (TIGR03545 family)
VSRTLRWQIWLPRLLLVVVLLLAAQYGLGLATRSIAIRCGAAATGGTVEVAHARVSFVDRRVVLRDVRVANPAEHLKNLIEADRCEFDIAAAPLSHKQLVVETGLISGLRFNTPRDESGALADREPSPMGRSLQWFNDEYPDRAQDWLEHVDRRFDPELVKQSHAIQRTAELCERSSQQSTELVRRARQLTQRAVAVQREHEDALSNPLRHTDYLKSAPDQIAALQREFAELTAEVERLPTLVDNAQRAIVAARRQDQDWLREELRIPRVDAAVMNGYLLEQPFGRPLDEIMGWLRFAREMAPAQTAQTPSSSKRGDEIFFAGCVQPPGLLVRSLALRGTASVVGQPVAIRGALSDFASTPALHGKPLRLRLTTSGSLPLELQATIDRSGNVAHDELLVTCQGLVLPKGSLGESDHLRLELAPSVGSLSINIQLQGDQLTGDIRLEQKQVRITPLVGGKLSDVPLAAALAGTLGGENSVSTQLLLSGTIDDPRCKLRSTLGGVVADALDRAVRRAADQHATKMLAELQRQVDQRLTQLERQLAEDQAELMPQLSQTAGQLEKIATQQDSPPRLSTEQLGRRLPAQSLFR